jgi:hypothetical protein
MGSAAVTIARSASCRSGLAAVDRCGGKQPRGCRASSLQISTIPHGQCGRGGFSIQDDDSSNCMGICSSPDRSIAAVSRSAGNRYHRDETLAYGLCDCGRADNPLVCGRRRSDEAFSSTCLHHAPQHCFAFRAQPTAGARTDFHRWRIPARLDASIKSAWVDGLGAAK